MQINGAPTRRARKRESGLSKWRGGRTKSNVFVTSTWSPAFELSAAASAAVATLAPLCAFDIPGILNAIAPPFFFLAPPTWKW